MNYQITEERLRYLIIEIVKNLEIEKLYRVQVEFPKDKDVTPVVALFFEIVGTTYELRSKTEEVRSAIEGALGIKVTVLPISYSEAKFHLRKPRNV